MQKILITMMIIISITVVGCGNGKNDIVSWTNDQAVYAIIKS